MRALSTRSARLSISAPLNLPPPHSPSPPPPPPPPSPPPLSSALFFFPLTLSPRLADEVAAEAAALEGQGRAEVEGDATSRPAPWSTTVVIASRSSARPFAPCVGEAEEAEPVEVAFEVEEAVGALVLGHLEDEVVGAAAPNSRSVPSPANIRSSPLPPEAGCSGRPRPADVRAAAAVEDAAAEATTMPLIWSSPLPPSRRFTAATWTNGSSSEGSGVPARATSRSSSSWPSRRLVQLLTN